MTAAGSRRVSGFFYFVLFFPKRLGQWFGTKVCVCSVSEPQSQPQPQPFRPAGEDVTEAAARDARDVGRVMAASSHSQSRWSPSETIIKSLGSGTRQ